MHLMYYLNSDGKRVYTLKVYIVFLLLCNVSNEEFGIIEKVAVE